MTGNYFFAVLTLFTCVLAAAEDLVVDEPEIAEVDRDHWSYRPIVRPTIPQVKFVNWASTDIDRFVLAKLESKNIRIATRADKSTLIRRVYLDLIGLPPTPLQVQAFSQDRSPDAFRRVVDFLLASPEYGKRWGQYWLDLARFAETDGYEHDKIRPNAWRYRDWVIDALNHDMPYDQFVRWQIAGDVLAAQDPQASIATAFCLAGPDMPDINSQEERKHVLLNEITSTVGAALLGLQFGCAQCHDHKYDAVSQADFYRLRAFFSPAIQLSKNNSVTVLASHGIDPQNHLMIRGDWRRKGPQLQPAFPRIVNPTDRAVAADDPHARRAELARWLTARDHPLTARIIVNRLWQHHFGQGLSRTPSDFGVMGDEPSHPELLDYMAEKLIKNDWSLKQLHRQIVFSSVYQTRSSRPTCDTLQRRWDAARQIDPENRLLSHFPRRRLDAEAIRDCLFAVSGFLNHEAGGPGISPPLPNEMIKTLKSGQWKISPRRADHYRRSIYIFARRNLRYPLLATFDRPTANASCAARNRSTTAVQSLLLLNSDLAIEAAKRLAVSAFESTDDGAKIVDELYLRVFSRHPTPLEAKEAIDFWQQQEQLLNKSSSATESRETALTDLCRALLNANEFLYVD